MHLGLFPFAKPDSANPKNQIKVNKRANQNRKREEKIHPSMMKQVYTKPSVQEVRHLAPSKGAAEKKMMCGA